MSETSIKKPRGRPRIYPEVEKKIKVKKYRDNNEMRSNYNLNRRIRSTEPTKEELIKQYERIEFRLRMLKNVIDNYN